MLGMRGPKISCLLAAIVAGLLIWLNTIPYFIPSTLVGRGYPFCFWHEGLFTQREIAPPVWSIPALVGNCIVIAIACAAAKFVCDLVVAGVIRIFRR